MEETDCLSRRCWVVKKEMYFSLTLDRGNQNRKQIPSEIDHGWIREYIIQGSTQRLSLSNIYMLQKFFKRGILKVKLKKVETKSNLSFYILIPKLSCLNRYLSKRLISRRGAAMRAAEDGGLLWFIARNFKISLQMTAWGGMTSVWE